MKWETKDKLLKIGFILSIILFIIGIIFSYEKCQRDVVEKMLYESKSNLEQSICNKTSGCSARLNN